MTTGLRQVKAPGATCDHATARPAREPPASTRSGSFGWTMLRCPRPRCGLGSVRPRASDLRGNPAGLGSDRAVWSVRARSSRSRKPSGGSWVRSDRAHRPGSFVRKLGFARLRASGLVRTAPGCGELGFVWTLGAARFVRAVSRGCARPVPREACETDSGAPIRSYRRPNDAAPALNMARHSFGMFTGRTARVYPIIGIFSTRSPADGNGSLFDLPASYLTDQAAYRTGSGRKEARMRSGARGIKRNTAWRLWTSWSLEPGRGRRRSCCLRSWSRYSSRLGSGA